MTTPQVSYGSPDHSAIAHRPRPKRFVFGGIAVGLVAVGLAARWPLLSYPGFLHDQDQFVMWAHVAASRGVGSVYDRYDRGGTATALCNYPPVYVYVCRSLASIYPLVTGRALDVAAVDAILQRQDTPDVRTAYVLFKLPAVLADLATAILLMVWLSRRGSLLFSTVVAALYVLHPAVLHDSSVWGQIDAIPTLLVIGSLECARQKKYGWMWAWATIAALTKPQTLVFLPVWLMISRIHFGADARKWVRSACVVGLLAVVLVAPFWSARVGVKEAYVGAPSYYPFTHLNGFSAWFLKDPLLEPAIEDNRLDAYVRDDRPVVLGITARNFGLFGFLIIWGVAIEILRRRRGDERSIFWAARIIPLGFFVLSTQMHERYLFSAMAIWAWSARPNWRWWTCWIVLGACVAVNMLWVWMGPCSGDFLRIQQELFHRTWLGQPPGVWCSAALIAILAASLIRIWQAMSSEGLKNPT